MEGSVVAALRLSPRGTGGGSSVSRREFGINEVYALRVRMPDPGTNQLNQRAMFAMLHSLHFQLYFRDGGSELQREWTMAKDMLPHIESIRVLGLFASDVMVKSEVSS